MFNAFGCTVMFSVYCVFMNLVLGQAAVDGYLNDKARFLTLFLKAVYKSRPTT